jgi:tetratricopeptide (TPR) repeat protein
MKKLQLLSFFLLLVLVLPAQNYFKNYKNGEAFYAKKEYQAAIDEFTKVIEMKSEHDRAYNLRGLSYVGLNNDKKAAEDFKKATEIKSKNSKYHFNLGKAYYRLSNFESATVSFSLAIKHDKKLMEAYEYNTLSLINLKQYQKAVDNAKLAVAKNKSGKNYYMLGISEDSLMHYDEAAYSFGRAVYYSPKLKEAHIGLAHTNLKLNKLDKALASCEKAIKLEGDNVAALLMRSQVHLANKTPQKAVDDLSQVIAECPKNVKYFIKRGIIYQNLGQHQNAIGDFTKAISIRPDYYFYYQRAKSYEGLSDNKMAVKDYRRLLKLSANGSRAEKIFADAKVRLYELNKESDNPKIEMIDPISPKEGIVSIPKGAVYYNIKGQIKDASTINFIKINGKDASFEKDSLNPIFELEVIIENIEDITITAFDSYQNSETWVFKILTTEVDTPVIKLMSPYASDDGTIYLDSDDPTLYIEGVINDESFIKSILVGGATAAFVLDKKNPTFSATINIMNKDDFTITVVDEYGNKSVKKFVINRENIGLLADNPMGKTWVVFIENSNYKSFASLDGPAKDVTMMKSAFAKYKIHNVVHKKNMTKAQFEKFFSIELRDLVRSNRVNSLLVWYAGHGKFINETGYWIPTDAKRDDEFTYYNINNLKAAMQSYSKFITHTLVITDACESGPSFYQAMRSTPKAKSCNDWKATKFKSSQVFSSAGYELATDNSQFTKTFANTLKSNPNSCIPIETIVIKVKNAVGKGGKQKPKFGKIAGLEDENGTFFFIKK